jgi:hypothetical protein
MIKIERAPVKTIEVFRGTLDFDTVYTFEVHKTSNGKVTYNTNWIETEGAKLSPESELYTKMSQAIENMCKREGLGNEVKPSN